MADILEVVDDGASKWFKEALSPSRDPNPDGLGVKVPKGDPEKAPPGRIHLLLGCSIARDAGIGVEDGDLVLNRAIGGNTWAKVSSSLDEDLRLWREAADVFGMERGRVVIWLSGNEAYDRLTGLNLMNDAPRGQLEAIIRGVLAAVGAVSEPVVLGPLARFWVDRLLPWEHTASYKLDRKEKEAAEEEEASFISLGKTLTKKLRGRHVVVEECRQWYQSDGVHLTREGYRKVAGAELFPSWLTVNNNLW